MENKNQLVVINSKESALLKAKNFLDVTKSILVKKETDTISPKVWKDPKTQLMWQVKLDSDQYSYKDAFEYAKRLNTQKYGGYNDWRVPNIEELRTITGNSLYNNNSYTKRTYIKPIFLNSMNMYLQEFWSSSSSCENSAFRARFAEGSAGDRMKEDSLFVRCVRGHTNRKGLYEDERMKLEKKRTKAHKDFLNAVNQNNEGIK